MWKRELGVRLNKRRRDEEKSLKEAHGKRPGPGNMKERLERKGRQISTGDSIEGSSTVFEAASSVVRCLAKNRLLTLSEAQQSTRKATARGRGKAANNFRILP